MAYKLKFSVTKDLPTKTESLYNVLEQDYILSDGKDLDSLNIDFNEIENICILQNITLASFLSKLIEKPSVQDCYCYPKINGDAADVYLMNEETNKQIKVLSFLIIDSEKTQKLHEKFEKMGKNIKNSKILPIVDASGKKSIVYIGEQEKQPVIFLDKKEYQKNYNKISKKMAENGKLFQIIETLKEKEVDVTVEEAYKMF